MIPKLELVHPDDIRQTWPALRPGIEKALADSSDDDLPEDVFMALATGNAGCYACLPDPQKEGGVATSFFIARKLQISGRFVLVVWIGFNDSQEANIARFWDQVVEVAKGLGCSRVVIESTRPYHRAIPGVKLVSHTFHYEVGDE